MLKILVAEDDVSTNKLLCAILKINGYEAIPAFNGEAALDIIDHQHIDLLLCDVMMPKMDGFALTQAIRDGGSMMPILMLTAKALPEDKHTGFLVGTDDYMTKPPDKTELLLRIKALLRRARIVDEHKITVGDVVVDMDSHTVRRGMEVQTLPPKEFELLYKLLAYPDGIAGRDLGHRQRERRQDRECPHQPSAQPLLRLAGVRDPDRPWPWLPGREESVTQ